jgi:hypothetical protein
MLINRAMPTLLITWMFCSLSNCKISCLSNGHVGSLFHVNYLAWMVIIFWTRTPTLTLVCWEALRTPSCELAIWKEGWEGGGGGYFLNKSLKWMCAYNANGEQELVVCTITRRLWNLRREEFAFSLFYHHELSFICAKKEIDLLNLIRVESDFDVTHTKYFSWWYVFIVQTLNEVLILFGDLFSESSLWGTWPGFVLNISPKFLSLDKAHRLAMNDKITHVTWKLELW